MIVFQKRLKDTIVNYLYDFWDEIEKLNVFYEKYIHGFRNCNWHEIRLDKTKPKTVHVVFKTIFLWKHKVPRNNRVKDGLCFRLCQIKTR